MAVCASDNSPQVDQSSFWNSSGVNWDTHRIGWAISGGCAALTLILSLINVFRHSRHYICPPEQRQILRILYMPPVYAIISFFSYRYFRSYTYYELVEVVYEAVTISAFMLLLIEYVASTASDHSATKALERKDKRPLPIPFCCWRYRPTKAYFMYSIKWSVMQYVIVRPAVSVVAIIAQKRNVLCENGGFDFHFAYAYIEIIDCISITVALYGLLVFYGLTHEELQGRRPLAKFLCIKLIVMFTFYQSFVFSILEGRVIKATQYWTETNIADGLNALTICIEMVLFAAAMLWAYPASEYSRQDPRTTSIWRPLWDSINYSDFAREILSSFKFFFDYIRRKPGTHSHPVKTTDGRKQADFGEAFGIADGKHNLGATGVSLRSYNISNPRPYNYDNTTRNYAEAAPVDSPASGVSPRYRSESGPRGVPAGPYDDTVQLTTYNSRRGSPTGSSARPSNDTAMEAPGGQQGYGVGRTRY